MQVGHIQLGTDGLMWDVDAAMCDMMEQTSDAMIGRSVIDITYPPDRDQCRRCMRALQTEHRPFAVVKRMMLADGSPFWVTKTVALATFDDAIAPVMATVTRAADPADVTPTDMLRQARLLVGDLRDRREWLDSPIFVDPPSSVLLNAYVAEAEGRLADVDAMAADAGVAKGVLERWMRAMADQGLIEREGRPDAEMFGYRLTQQALEQCERYLMHRTLVQRSGAGS